MVGAQSCEVDASVLLVSGLGLFSIVGLPWLYPIPSLADVTMGTKASNLTKAATLN
jgi:hypothetical protein